MKKKIIYVLCILGVLLVLLGLKKRNDTMYSSGVYHLNRSGIVESIENNNIVVRLDKLNEQDEDFKNVDTLQLDCRNCGYELENLKEGKKIIFYYFPYNADIRPLKVENIYVINEKESNIDLMKKAGQLLDPYRDKTDESIYARGKSGGVITTKDIEQATEFYILAGYEQSDAEDKAVEYMLQRDATYQRAIAAGYSVSDDEINDYIEESGVKIYTDKDGFQYSVSVPDYLLWNGNLAIAESDVRYALIIWIKPFHQGISQGVLFNDYKDLNTQIMLSSSKKAEDQWIVDENSTILITIFEKANKVWNLGVK